MQELEFDFREGHSRIFGKVFRPFTSVTLKNGGKETSQFMLVDSGADLTLISKSVGDYLGLTLTSDEIIEVKGVGERGIPVVLKKVNIKIGDKEVETTLAWSLVEEIPLLLGRKDIFNNFEITFKDNKTIFRY